MMLIEQTAVPTTALPVAQFKDHLRLGTGFADAGVQDAVLESFLRSSVAAIEARTGKITISRSFKWTVSAWRALAEQALPVAPVSVITALNMIDRQNQVTLIDPARYRLEQDDQRPRILATGACLPSIPTGGHAEVEFDAGFGPVWGDLPADLAQAILLLAAFYYERRTAMAPGETEMPFGVSALIERYRTVRLFGGAAH